jgi:hypothetical protein
MPVDSVQGDYMPDKILSLAILLVTCWLCAEVRAEHAKIALEVSTSRGQVTAHVDQTPPESGKNPRPEIKARANEAIRIQWNFTNVYPHKTLENVVLHFFVARQEKVGQKSLPDLSGDVETETAFEMDLRPGAKAGQRSRLRIARPGVYLIRIGSRQTQSDHEHFAAVDLVVEDARTP